MICYGRGGDISANRREEVEMTALCLRIMQKALVYVNTLVLQDVLADEAWSGLLGEHDRRGLTPLFTVNITPYGEIQLNLDRRLDLAAGSGPAQGLQRLAAGRAPLSDESRVYWPWIELLDGVLAVDLAGVPVAIAENPTNPPLACADVVLFGLGQRVLRRAAGSASAVTWAESARRAGRTGRGCPGADGGIWPGTRPISYRSPC